MTERSPKTARASVTILVVDPDHAARASARGFLESHGYRVLDAGDPATAEQIARLYVAPIHVLLIEVGIDGTGPALADRLRSLRPEPDILFASSATRDVLVRAGHIAADEKLIQKPFTAQKLAASIRSLLDARLR